MNQFRHWSSANRDSAVRLAQTIRTHFGALSQHLPTSAEILIVLVAASLLTLWLYLTFRPAVVEIQLSSTRMLPDKGHAYIAKIPKPNFQYIVEFTPDTGDAPTVSSLQVYENGKLSGSPHWSRETVRSMGEGRFTHRRRQFLYFSTADNSSPLTNGRDYSIRAALAPTSLTRGLALFAILILLWRGYFNLSFAVRRAVLGRLIRIFRWTLRPQSGNWLFILPVSFALILLSWYHLLAVWQSAKTVNLAVGGFFQVSDSSGYAACANHVLDHATNGIRAAEYFSGWCLRRPLYSNFLASIFSITDRHWLSTLMVQTVFVALAMSVLFRAMAGLIGPAAGFTTLFVMFLFATEHVFSLTLTENLGFALGTVGLAFLLDAARLANRWLFFFGAACLSTALNARAGAFFALPFLLAACYFHPTPTSRRFKCASCLIAFCGILTGFALHFFVIGYLGGSIGASHSNFSQTLYGLSLGGKGWSQAYTDLPEIFLKYPEAEAGRVVYHAALANISNSPLLFAGALERNFFQYLRAGMSNWRLLWWIGVLAIALRWRDPVYSLTGFLTIGILLSAPFIYQDGGARVFAATWGVTAWQIGLGLHLILNVFNRFFDESGAPDTIVRYSPKSWDIAIATCLVAVILMPLTPIRNIGAVTPVSSQGCRAGEKELIARLGHESYMITLLGDDQPKNIWKMQVSARELLNHIGGTWFEKDFAMLPVPSTLIHGYQIMEGHFGDDVRLVWSGDLGRYYGKTVSVCYRTDQSISVADNPYYRAVRVHVVGS